MPPFDDALAFARAYGVEIVEVDGWRTRERAGSFNPVGVLNHHTASRARPGDPVPSLAVVRDGRAGLAGPLCNLLVGRDAVVRVISDGRANDSGRGSSKVLARVRRGEPPLGDAAALGLSDDTDGNPWFVDVEVENDGVGEPYPDDVLRTLFCLDAALCRAYGWSADRCLMHREWTRRKVDMSWRGALRPAVAAVLHSGPPAPPRPAATFPEDALQRHDIAITTDGNGHGWAFVPVPAERVVSIVTQGPYPPVDGYWELGVFGRQARDGRTVVTVTEGPARTTVHASVWVAG
jgi:hypothetical protein